MSAKTIIQMIGVAGTVMLTGMAAFAVSSEPVLVDADMCNRHWSTSYTNALSLHWNWETNASHAVLEVAGMNSAFTTNFLTNVSNWVWQAFGTPSPSVEDVFDLTLRFKDDGGNTVGMLTSRLAVVMGAFGQAVIDGGASHSSWSKIKANAVIPYDAAWDPVSATNAVATRLEIARVGGISQTNALGDVAGYTGWRVKNSGWGYGLFNLSLSFTGATNVWMAELVRPLDGTAFSLQ